MNTLKKRNFQKYIQLKTAHKGVLKFSSRWHAFFTVASSLPKELFFSYFEMLVLLWVAVAQFKRLSCHMLWLPGATQRKGWHQMAALDDYLPWWPSKVAIMCHTYLCVAPGNQNMRNSSACFVFLVQSKFLLTFLSLSHFLSLACSTFPFLEILCHFPLFVLFTNWVLPHFSDLSYFAQGKVCLPDGSLVDRFEQQLLLHGSSWSPAHQKPGSQVYSFSYVFITFSPVPVVEDAFWIKRIQEKLSEAEQ